MSEVASFGDLFRVGARYEWDDGPDCEIDVVAAGQVELPTGAVVAADPDWAMRRLEEDAVVAATVHPGSYPVFLAVATWQESPNPAFASPMRQVCAAKIRILQDPVVSWRPARTSIDSAEPAPLGVPVDSGTASFFDFSARQWLGGLQSDDDHWKRAREYMKRDLYARFEDPDSSASVIMFECSMGDGVYGLRLGMTQGDDIAEIGLDLELLSHSLGPVQ